MTEVAGEEDARTPPRNGAVVGRLAQARVDRRLAFPEWTSLDVSLVWILRNTTAAVNLTCNSGIEERKRCGIGQP